MNFIQMKKAEIIWAATHRCQHGSRYIEHPACYDRECRDSQKVGFLDIEASNLKADFGIVLCYCIAELDSDRIIGRVLTKEELFSTKYAPDYKLMRDCVEDMRKFDRLIGYYSGDYKFDLPFLRTRAVSQGVEFPEYGSITFEDVYITVKAKFRLSSNRLATSSRMLVGETNKTPWASEHWIRAVQGNKKSLDYILDHCKKDVTDLKKLYLKVYPFTKHTNRSI